MNADLTNARNPSAVVLSRIQRVKDDGGRNSAAAAQSAAAAAVEEYLARNGVDEVAANALRMLPFEVNEWDSASKNWFICWN